MAETICCVAFDMLAMGGSTLLVLYCSFDRQADLPSDTERPTLSSSFVGVSVTTFPPHTTSLPPAGTKMFGHIPRLAE